MSLSEKDWRAFNTLKADTLERYCESTLEGAAALCAETERTAHERYLALWRLIDERNRAMGKAFDGHSRSRALFQLRVMHDMGLISDIDLHGFMPEDGPNDD